MTASARYGNEVVSPEPLAQELHLQPSGRTVKNRFLKSPMAEGLATWSPKVKEQRGVPTDELVELYGHWGEGKNNWGIIVTGNVDIELDAMDGLADMVITPELAPEGERFDKFKEVAAAAKKDGSLIVAQVSHPGRQVQYRLNPVAISASDVQLEPKLGMTFGKPHAASKDEIARIIEGFSHAAAYLEKAGFDGIELHAAHGYLISQFLSRTTNKRTDEYGAQNMENRLRLISEIVEGIKARVSPNFIVAAKLNSVEFQDGGVTPDEAKELVETLEKLGLDFVELSGGTYENLGMSYEKESTRQREGFFLEWAEKVTASLSPDRKIKVFIAGGLRSVSAMIKALDVVDGVSLGRPATAEPRLAADIIEGRVQGALKHTDQFENDFMMGMGIAQAQISQLGKGREPMNHNDEEVMKIFAGDMGAWYVKSVEDGEKMEEVRAVQYSGSLEAYGAVLTK